jgi:hypothetical protein
VTIYLSKRIKEGKIYFGSEYLKSIVSFIHCSRPEVKQNIPAGGLVEQHC